jgi:AAA15 family ATPase/GTPase
MIACSCNVLSDHEIRNVATAAQVQPLSAHQVYGCLGCNIKHLDVTISQPCTCVIGENNTGKSNFLHAIRLCIDAGLSSAYRSLIPTDIHSTVDISEPSQVLESLLRSSKVP